MKYLKIILLSLLACLAITSCNLKRITQVPLQTVEKIVYKDTVVYVRDSITVKVPYEKVKEVIALMDTSIIKTSVAESVAYVDTAKRKIHHTLTQKGDIKSKVDTIVRVQYVEKIVEKDVYVPTEVIKYKRDALFWCLAGWAFLCILLVVIKLFVLK
jgi:hypothetical protein